jgi:plastocyanin
MTRIHRGLRTAGGVLLALGTAAACSGGGGGGGGGGGDGPTGSSFGSVAGQVTAGGAAVAGVTVSIAGAGSATTAANGGFRIDNVPVGSRTAAITLPEGMITASVDEPISKSVTVAEGQTAAVSWTLKPGRLVRASGVSFAPAALSVPVGTTVRWVAAEAGHTVTPDDPAQAGAWQSAPLGPSESFEHTFGQAGSFPFHCVPHRAAGMTGVVNVTP